MNEFDSLREKSWRRKLTAGEEASLREWLAEHPEAKRDWEKDLQLTEALEKLPDVPVPSNFTARVLEAIERESEPASQSSSLIEAALVSTPPPTPELPPPTKLPPSS